MCSCELYPLAIQKGFKKVYTASNKNNKNNKTVHYTYHGLKGIVLRSKSEIDESVDDIIEGKNINNVGELRTNNT